jgi:phosphatidylethanolamine-binding protein (PEBP) family uncharacterized protein
VRAPTPRSPRLAVGWAVAAAIVAGLAACGSGSDAPATTASGPAATIAVKSAALAGERIQTRYTCDGQNISPPLEWGTVPAGVDKLALFLVGFRQKPGTKKYTGTVEWAVAGLSPSLHRLAAGRLPPGSYLGVAQGNRQRYSLCPAKGQSVHYQFEIYGVPNSLAIPPGFSGISILRSLTTGPTPALAHGGFVALYSRR